MSSYPPAMLMEARIYDNMSNKMRRRKKQQFHQYKVLSLKFYEVGVFHDDAESMFILGKKYLHGISVPQDNEKAIYLLRESSALNNAHACMLLADFFREYVSKSSLKSIQNSEDLEALIQFRNMEIRRLHKVAAAEVTDFRDFLLGFMIDVNRVCFRDSLKQSSFMPKIFWKQKRLIGIRVKSIG